MTALKYNKFLDHPNPKPPKMRFRLSAKSFADISDLFRMSPKRLADNSAFIDVSSDRSADKSSIDVISSDRSADNSDAFRMFKKMFADNSITFGMSLSRILLLQPFRSKFLFRVFADAYLFYHQFFHGFKNPRLFALAGFPSSRRLPFNVHRSSYARKTVILNLFQDLTASLHLSISADRC